MLSCRVPHVELYISALPSAKCGLAKTSVHALHAGCVVHDGLLQKRFFLAICKLSETEVTYTCGAPTTK